MQREPGDLEPDGEWRRDPTGRNGFRFWDGSDWTDRVSNFGVRSVDPVNGSTTTVVTPPKSRAKTRPKSREKTREETVERAPEKPPKKTRAKQPKKPKQRADAGAGPARPWRHRARRSRSEPRPEAAATPTVPRRVRVREHRPASTSGRLKTAGGTVVLLGAALAAVGTIVPLQPGPDNTNYLHSTDGAWIALTSILVAFIALFGILSRQSSRLPAVVVVVIGLGMVAVVYPDYQDLDRAVGRLDWSSGILLSIVGAFVVIAGGVIAIVGQTQ